MSASRIEKFIEPPFVIERGESPDTVVIGFAGFGGWLATHPNYFYVLSSLVRYTRIMLRDPTQTCYLAGIPPVANGYRALLDLLNETITYLAPKKILAFGTSGGAWAALLFGHELKVDYVHAFAPFTYSDAANIKRYADRELQARHRKVLARIRALPGEAREIVDLHKVLSRHNGKTRYFVHYCEGRAQDVARARHIADCPHVTLLNYPCAVHQVAESLAQMRLLDAVLKMENQERLPQLVGERLAKGIERPNPPAKYD